MHVTKGLLLVEFKIVCFFLVLCIIKFKINWVGKNALVVTNLFFPQKTFIVAKGLGLVFFSIKKRTLLYYYF